MSKGLNNIILLRKRPYDYSIYRSVQYNSMQTLDKILTAGCSPSRIRPRANLKKTGRTDRLIGVFFIFFPARVVYEFIAAICVNPELFRSYCRRSRISASVWSIQKLCSHFYPLKYFGFEIRFVYKHKWTFLDKIWT